MAHDRFQSWISEWAPTWGTPELLENVRVVFSTRLRRSLGRCMPTTGEIRLHAGLRDGPVALLREVLCHEAAHVAVHLLHGRRVRPHGKEWARLMRIAGYEPKARMSLDRLPEFLRAATRTKKLWEHRCRVCGAARTARRPVRRWRCRACWESGRSGRLEITARARVPEAVS